MQGYSTGNLGPLIKVYYIAYVEDSRQGYNMGSFVPLNTVHYIG
jgi:hypothetical protein